jgi:hypothetical protein
MRHPATKSSVVYFYLLHLMLIVNFFILYALVSSTVICVCHVHFVYSISLHVKSYTFFCCQQELVHRVEGFKHVSWKNDKEIDEICNFTFSVAELSKQNLCSEGIINAKAIPEPVADCGEGSSSSNSFSTVTSQVPEMSDGGDFKQCGKGHLDVTFDGATLRLSSVNGTVAGPDSNTGVTGSNTDLCVTLKTPSEDDVPRGQASLPQNAEVPEGQGSKDKTAEYCGILKEINVLADNAENIAPNFVMPLKVDCDVTIPNDCNTDGTVLNDTFVLAAGSPLRIHNISSRSFGERSYNQQNIQNTGIK